MKFLLKRLEQVMKKIIRIALKEFLEAVRSKSFILGFVITAIVFFVLFFVVKKASKSKPVKEKTLIVSVLDSTGKLGDELHKVFNKRYSSEGTVKYFLAEVFSDDSEKRIDAEKKKIRSKGINAFVYIDKSALEGEGASKIFTEYNNISGLDSLQNLKNIINEAVLNYRFVENNISQEFIEKLAKRVNLELINIAGKSEKKNVSSGIFMIPFFFMYLMFLGIMGVSQQLLTTVIEEKNSRICEVLLSCVSPFELMAGKIIGLSGVGFVLIVVWGSVAIGFAMYYDYMNFISKSGMIFFIFYFIPGFLFYASLIAAIGSTCNTIREAQNYMSPLMICAIIPLMVWFYIAQNPESTLSTWLSFLPPATPFVMILRLTVMTSPPYLQIASTLLLLLISTVIAMWLSAKIFRVGILMYGKQPTPKEIFKWLKYR